MRKRLLILILGTVGVAMMAAQKIEISAQVDATRIGRDDTLILTITFQGADIVQAPPLDSLTDFRILQISQRVESQMINNVPASANVSFSYELAPNRTGSLTIPAFTFTIQGAPYSTPKFQVQVVPGSVNPQSSAGQRVKHASESDDPFNAFQSDKPEKVFLVLKSRVSKPRVLEGEQVLYRVFLCTLNRVESASLLSKPSIPGFWQEWFPDSPQVTGRREKVDGVVCQVFEIRKAALFPTRSGQLSIPAFNFSFNLFDEGSLFFGSRPALRSSPEAVIRVDPLPSEQAGLPVGVFTFDVRADRSAIDSGDLLTLWVTISGTGNVKSIDPPRPPSSDRYTVYPPKITRENDFDQEQLVGKIVSQIPVSFATPGPSEIPSLSFSYVDPESRRTLTLNSLPIQVQVAKKSMTTGGPREPEPAQVDRKSEDIAYIVSGSFDDLSRISFRQPLFLALFFLPFVASGVFLAKLLVWDRWLKKSSRRQRKRLLFETLQRLSRSERHEDIASILDYFLAQRTGLGFSELSVERISALFRLQGIPSQAVERFLIIKTHAEYSKYSAQKENFRELGKDIDEIKKLIQQIDEKMP